MCSIGPLGLTRAASIASTAGVKQKEASEALKQLVTEGLIDTWPAIKAYKITTKGLEAAAAIEARPVATFQWQWRKNHDS